MRRINHTIIGFLGGLLVVFLVFFFTGVTIPPMMHHSIEKQREDFITLKKDILGDLMPHGDYRCCLEKPCTYCIEKTPGHGVGATCDCLKDVVEGVHPCGECIGEILEGHGNPFLADYFAASIAEEVGEEHLDTLQQIVKKKYGLAIEEQRTL
jgi:hypothetical protein